MVIKVIWGCGNYNYVKVANYVMVVVGAEADYLDALSETVRLKTMWSAVVSLSTQK